MIDLKVDFAAFRNAKDLKANMLHRLKQIDIENSGLITIDSLISIAEKYGLKLSTTDCQVIREKYRKVGQHASSQKVDYINVINDIRMKLDIDGNI